MAKQESGLFTPSITQIAARLVCSTTYWPQADTAERIFATVAMIVLRSQFRLLPYYVVYRIQNCMPHLSGSEIK